MGGWAVRGERGPREEKGWGEMRVGYREGVGRAGGEKEGDPVRGRAREERKRRERVGGWREGAQAHSSHSPLPLPRHHLAPAVNSSGQAVADFHNVFISSSI